MTPNTPARPAPPTASVELEVPADWKEVPPGTPFTLAEWELPGGGRCTITQVGGGVQANLGRWAAQFHPGGDSMEIEVLRGADYPTTMAVIRGTFTATRSIGGGPPRSEWMLVGAGIEHTQLGDLYVKAVAPASSLEEELQELRQKLVGLRLSPVEAAAATPPAAAPAAPHIRFAPPTDWTPALASYRFTLAQWTLPGGGVCTITQVGGGVQPNLMRWAGQFQVPSGDPASEMQTEKLEGANYPTTWATIRGSFTATRAVGGGPPREGWMLVGAGLEGTPLGEVYVKAVGPAETLSKQVQDLRRACAQISFP